MHKKQLMLFSLFLCTLIAFSAIPASATISPTELTATLSPGESIDEVKTVEIGSVVPYGDVMFALDLTASMKDEIQAAKDSASAIMTEIGSVISNVQFGVISFMDYVGYYESYNGIIWYNATYGYASSGDYPYSLNQSLTSDQTLVNNTIYALTLGSGGDPPQDYTRIIYESYTDTNIGWRTGATKFLVLFGDAQVHDLDFYYPSNRGGDPGPDAIMGTSDDLDFETTVAAAAAAGIKIIVINCGSAVTAFQYMATETGGDYALLWTAEDIVDVITDAITTAVHTIGELKLSPTVGYEDWVAVNTSYSDVERPATRYFEVTITVPGSTLPGLYEFEIWADGDGSDYGRQSVSITVPPTTIITGMPLFSDILAMLPLGIIAGVVIIRRRRKDNN